MKNLIIIVSVGILLCSCVEDEASGLYDTWEWTETSGGYAGVLMTPETEGYSQSLEISESTIKRYKNDSLISECIYALDTAESIRGEDCPVIIYESGLTKSYILEGDMLTLYDEFYDGCQSEYTRQ